MKTMMTIWVRGTMMIKSEPLRLKNNPKYLVVVTGPTAIGKTDIAIQIARRFKTVILSADSRQFYRELKVGTAAPSQAELQAATHYFVGHLTLDQYYNVSMFEQEALMLLDKLFQKHNIVLLCGGSGLYIDAVCEGIDAMPDIDANIRTEINQKFIEKGIDYLRSELAKADPEYFSIVDQNNPNRMKRALEVCISTGKTFTSFRKKNFNPRNFDIIKIGLNTQRAELHQKIETRTEMMIKQGLVDEVTSLLPYRNFNALNTVGYKEIFEFLDGKINLPQAIENIKTNTRRYARRQITWLRRYDEIVWFSPENIDPIISFIEKKTCKS